MSYAKQERAERKPRRIIDHTATWERLEDAAQANGQAAERLERFCATKRITLAGLDALGARVVHRRGGGRARVRGQKRRRRGDGDQVPAARRLARTTRRRKHPSTWLRPIVVGKRDSLDWIVAEGETDAARLVRPRRRRRRGARAPGRRSHLQARVGRGHPARRPRRRSATTPTRTATPAPRKPRRSSAARRCGCARPSRAATGATGTGGRDEFLELVARRAPAALRVLDAHRLPRAPVPESRAAARRARARSSSRVGSLLMVYGADGSGEIDVDDRRHRAPGRRRRVARHPGAAAGAHLHHRERRPAEPLPAEARREDRDAGTAPSSRTTCSCSRGRGASSRSPTPKRARRSSPSATSTQIDLVTANPTLGLGVAASGRPDETQQFVDWLVECGLKSDARVLAPAPREQGRPDLAATGAATPTRRCSSSRTATGRAPSSTGRRPAGRRCRRDQPAKVVHARVDHRDAGLQRHRARHRRRSPTPSSRSASPTYLAEHPFSSTTTVETKVKGTASRIRKVLDRPRFDSIGGKRGARSVVLDSDPVGVGRRRGDGVNPQSRMSTGLEPRRHPVENGAKTRLTPSAVVPRKGTTGSADGVEGKTAG